MAEAVANSKRTSIKDLEAMILANQQANQDAISKLIDANTRTQRSVEAILMERQPKDKPEPEKPADQPSEAKVESDQDMIKTFFADLKKAWAESKPTTQPNDGAVVDKPSAPAAAAVAPSKDQSKATKTTAEGGANSSVETSSLVRAIGAIILAGGIVAALWYAFGGTGLLNILLYVALPVLALAVAARLISWGTLQIVWNGDIEGRVQKYLGEMNKPAATAAA